MGISEKKGIKKSFWIAALALLVAVMIFLFLIIRRVNQNPLLGQWRSSDKNMTIEFGDDGSFSIKELKAYENTEVEPKLVYEWDKKGKTVEIELTDKSAGELRRAVGSFVSIEDIMNSVGEPDSRFDYSIAGKTLTLTGREYGNRTEFERQ